MVSTDNNAIKMAEIYIDLALDELLGKHPAGGEPLYKHVSHEELPFMLPFIREPHQPLLLIAAQQAPRTFLAEEAVQYTIVAGKLDRFIVDTDLSGSKAVGTATLYVPEAHYTIVTPAHGSVVERIGELDVEYDQVVASLKGDVSIAKHDSSIVGPSFVGLGDVTLQLPLNDPDTKISVYLPKLPALDDIIKILDENGFIGFSTSGAYTKIPEPRKTS